MFAGACRVAATATAALVLASAAARGQVPVMVQGVVAGEGWFTDTSSNLLSKNGGRPAGAGKLLMWGALEPVRGLALYGLLEGETESGEVGESEFEQYGVRYTASRRLVVDAGRIIGPIGSFAARRFANRNPLVGEPDGYVVQYPMGAQLSGVARGLDYRLAVVSQPVHHEDYVPEPSDAWRPALALGFTPYVGVRIGASYTWGPYLNDELTAAQLAQRDWRDYEQRIAAAELSVSVGYAEIFAELARSSYDVPNRAEPIDGLTYYLEAKYTFTPRFYAAARAERNDYPFIMAGPTFWVARKTDFHDEEVGVGFRLTASTLAKASYRWDKWQVNASNQAFVRPGGHAFAVQLSQSFDVMDWVDRARAR